MARGRKPTPPLAGHVSFHEARDRLGSGFNPYIPKYYNIAVVKDGRHYFSQETFDREIVPNYKKRRVHRLNSLKELPPPSPAEAAAPEMPNVAYEPPPVAASKENFLYPGGIDKMTADQNPRISAAAKSILQSLGEKGGKKVEYVLRCILGPDGSDGKSVAVVHNFARLMEVYDQAGETKKRDYFVKNFSGLSIFGRDARSRAACKNMLKVEIGDEGVDESGLMSLYAVAGDVVTQWKVAIRDESRRRKHEASRSISRLK